MSAIEIENLSFAYHPGRPVLTDLNFMADGQENIGLIGANGVGKSTLLKLLVGLIGGYEGNIRVGGLAPDKKNLANIRKMAGYVFQDSESQLFMSTVYEDVAFGPRNYGCSPQEVDALVGEALKKVHMEHLKNRQIYRLSGGEKKLAAIATVLSMEPQIMLLDEPSGALDPRNRRNLIHILNEMDGLKLIASHDLDLVLDTCERTILLSGGSIVRDGATRDILSNGRLLTEHGLELPLCMQ